MAKTPGNDLQKRLLGVNFEEIRTAVFNREKMVRRRVGEILIAPEQYKQHVRPISVALSTNYIERLMYRWQLDLEEQIIENGSALEEQQAFASFLMLSNSPRDIRKNLEARLGAQVNERHQQAARVAHALEQHTVGVNEMSGILEKNEGKLPLEKVYGKPDYYSNILLVNSGAQLVFDEENISTGGGMPRSEQTLALERVMAECLGSDSNILNPFQAVNFETITLKGGGFKPENIQADGSVGKIAAANMSNANGTDKEDKKHPYYFATAEQAYFLLSGQQSISEMHIKAIVDTSHPLQAEHANGSLEDLLSDQTSGVPMLFYLPRIGDKGVSLLFDNRYGRASFVTSGDLSKNELLHELALSGLDGNQERNPDIALLPLTQPGRSTLLTEYLDASKLNVFSDYPDKRLAEDARNKRLLEKIGEKAGENFIFQTNRGRF